MDSLILTSLSKTIEYIDVCAAIDPADYRTLLFMSEIRNFAANASFRLLSSQTGHSRSNYNHPIAFPGHDDREACQAERMHAWAADSLEQIKSECGLPDDIDSTFSALYAIGQLQWKRRMPPARIVAESISNLEAVRDPILSHIFNTWMARKDDPEWNSSDIVAISSAIAFFDMIEGGHLSKTKSAIFDKLSAFLDSPIESYWFSEFYHSLPLAMYMISRCAWRDEERRILAEHIRRILQSPPSESASASGRIRPENHTDRALYVAAHICLCGEPLRLDEGFELPTPTSDDPLFIHSLRNDTTVYASSKLFSRLIWFEAFFGMHAQQIRSLENPDMRSNADAHIASPYDTLEMRATDRIRSILSEFEVFSDHKAMIEKLISGTDFQICLDICIALGRALPGTRSGHIGAANGTHAPDADPLLAHAMGLCVYYLYDKIYDNELPPQMLPAMFLANSVFQSQIQALTCDLYESGKNVPECIRCILTDTDISYFMLSRCRKPAGANSGTGTQLLFHAKKSTGSSLVPTLCALQAGANERAAESIRDFFMHFNLARQISDDAKDESEDSAASEPKITTMNILESQQEIEYAIFGEIVAANESISELSAAMIGATTLAAHIPQILQKRLDEFLIKALQAKWESNIVRNL